MHHQDFSGDAPGSRKSSFHFRRGSSGAPPSSTATGSGGNPGDDIPTQAGSSSPGLAQQSQASGAQVKKKSGFQITSVTSAQINVSGNNSLADDTESYDDMDESHTEDLSSSDMLDVSVSRATDVGVPERSSSDETLNSLHGVDTPGLVSPNEPLQPHSLSQGSQQHTSMVNGNLTHHFYPQQHSHHHSDSLGGGEPVLPISPLATSSPAMKTGPSQSQRILDNTTPASGTTHPSAPIVGASAADPQLQGGMNISNMSAVPTAAAAAVPSSGSAGFENTSASGPAGGTGPSAAAANAAAPNTQTQTQTATGSRFRVVKLDTNSEPFRKGRWTCTEFYEKEIPHPTAPEAPKGADLAGETEAGNAGINQGIPAVQPPHTLQPYQPPSQDFTSPQAMQSPPQGMVQTTPLSYVSPQEVIGVAQIQKPVAIHPTPTPQQLPYAVDPHQTQPQGGYPASQLHANIMAPGSVRQPDFIQPTAPFQNQVQPPLPHVTTGVPITVPGVTAQPAVGMSQQLPHQAAQGTFTGQLPAHQQPQIQPPSTAAVPNAPPQVNPYMPLTAVLQPLLAPGASFSNIQGGGSSIKTSQLEDAQRLLLQHQGLLSLPRLGAAGAGGEGAAEVGGAAGSLAHMGMSAEASAFMVAAAAGLRTQHAEGDEDSSSGASVVAIDNKIEQAMDLVKSHLMYAVREEVEVLKEQIKELIERNTQLEQENNLLKTLASPEQMAQFQAQVQTGSPTGSSQPPVPPTAGNMQALPSSQNSTSA